MRFALVLAATALCTPEQPLTPAQTVVGTAYDAQYGRRVLSPAIVATYYEADETLHYPGTTPAERLRGYLTKVTCASKATIVGSVRSSQQFLTPAKKYAYTEITLAVEHVRRQSDTAPITVGSTIKVTRAGGVICSDAGPLQVEHANQDPLERGERYLLFLTPVGNYYQTSDYDWHLGADGRAKKAHTGVTDDISTADLFASLDGIDACGE